MTAARAMALGLSDFAFFAPPPDRPTRPRRRTGNNGIAARLIRSIRRGLAHTPEAPATDWLPRLTNYPY